MSEKTGNFPFNISDVAGLLNLTVRQRSARSIYVDCPLPHCAEKKGKMNLNTEKNVFRCNYCGESGGMVALYAKTYGIESSDAYREICDSLRTGDGGREPPRPISQQPQLQPNSELASPEEIHQTYSMLFTMLSLTDTHRKKLRERGLSDEQINSHGYKSVPAYGYVSLTERLTKQGCTVKGVPGFFINSYGQWTVKFHAKASGILIPVKGIDGRVKGVQIRLDNSIDGRRYFWLSSVNGNMGVSSGSPTHFIGDTTSKVVYITEGPLKADVAHCLCGRTFVAVAGAGQHMRLGELFEILKQNGTEEIVEAFDMDKYQNEHVQKGCNRIYELASEFGFKITRLKWDDRYKGIDDWQLAIKQSEPNEKSMEEPQMETQQTQKYRIYQLMLENGERPPVFAFMSHEFMKEQGYSQPPAVMYQLVYESEVINHTITDNYVLEHLFYILNEKHPPDYRTRSLSMSDIVELYDDNERRYFYCDTVGFTEVKFSPALAKQTQ